jgi:hypothetical protein
MVFWKYNKNFDLSCKGFESKNSKDSRILLKNIIKIIPVGQKYAINIKIQKNELIKNWVNFSMYNVKKRVNVSHNSKYLGVIYNLPSKINVVSLKNVGIFENQKYSLSHLWISNDVRYNFQSIVNTNITTLLIKISVIM